MAVADDGGIVHGNNVVVPLRVDVCQSLVRRSVETWVLDCTFAFDFHSHDDDDDDDRPIAASPSSSFNQSTNVRGGGGGGGGGRDASKRCLAIGGVAFVLLLPRMRSRSCTTTAFAARQSRAMITPSKKKP